MSDNRYWDDATDRDYWDYCAQIEAEIREEEERRETDLIKRRDVLARKCKYYVYDEAGFCRTEFAVPVEDINRIPAVPQEMSAREFFATIQRMCPKIGCANCPVDEGDYCILDFVQDSDIEFVEKWAREHPDEVNNER